MDYGTNKIQRADMDGVNSNVEDVITGLGRPTDLALDLDTR